MGSLTVSYDAEGEQTQTSDSVLLVTANYTYDADGQRTQKTVNGVTTQYVHDAYGQLIAEYTNAAPSIPPCTTCYLSYDALGSVRLITDGVSGTATEMPKFPQYHPCPYTQTQFYEPAANLQSRPPTPFRPLPISSHKCK